jgi:hypothetical protein
MVAFDAGKIIRIDWPEFHITCSVCKADDFTELGNFHVKKDAEKEFRKRGWTKRKGLWICPTCE